MIKNRNKMLLLFSVGVADSDKRAFFFFSRFTICVFHELLYTSFSVALKDEMWGLSPRERERFNQFTMYVFPKLMLAFAYTSFPFGLDAGLWGLIVI